MGLNARRAGRARPGCRIRLRVIPEMSLKCRAPLARRLYTEYATRIYTGFNTAVGGGYECEARAVGAAQRGAEVRAAASRRVRSEHRPSLAAQRRPGLHDAAAA